MAFESASRMAEITIHRIQRSIRVQISSTTFFSTPIYKVKIYSIGFVLLLLTFQAMTLRAQPADIGNWYIYFGNQALNEKWNWHNEVQYRNFNLGGDLEQLLLRTGIGYNLEPNNHNVLLGYAFIRAEPYISGTDNRRVVDEHRIFEQYIFRQRLGALFITHRVRAEQRIFQDDFRQRFRYFLFLNYPLNQGTMTKGTIYGSTYAEIFINGERNLYDRTRLYLAVGYAFSDYIRVEIGFMSQVFSTTSREQFQVVLFNNLPF
ncbi:MAG: DUF2490 domain-containing protein [Chloroherpetonaceae bacterium]|nr:DUF2490 domain-containing protein [Chloroherpetonaceae bacterium]